MKSVRITSLECTVIGNGTFELPESIVFEKGDMFKLEEIKLEELDGKLPSRIRIVVSSDGVCEQFYLIVDSDGVVQSELAKFKVRLSIINSTTPRIKISIDIDENNKLHNNVSWSLVLERPEKITKHSWCLIL